MRKITKVCSVILALSALSFSVTAEERKPPKEAFEVCASKVEGAAVTFKGKNGKEVSAVCKKSKNDAKVLLAVPNDKPSGERPSKQK